MEMRASQVIKGALGGGAKRKKKEKSGGETERVKKRREERDTFKSTPVVRCGNWNVKQVSNIANLTSLDTKVVLTFGTFWRFHHMFLSRN